MRAIRSITSTRRGRLCRPTRLERFALIGNSLGGAICIRLALDHPERVERMVLMAPGGIESRAVYMGMKGIRNARRCFDPAGLTLEM